MNKSHTFIVHFQIKIINTPANKKHKEKTENLRETHK